MGRMGRVDIGDCVLSSHRTWHRQGGGAAVVSRRCDGVAINLLAWAANFWDLVAWQRPPCGLEVKLLNLKCLRGSLRLATRSQAGVSSAAIRSNSIVVIVDSSTALNSSGVPTLSHPPLLICLIACRLNSLSANSASTNSTTSSAPNSRLNSPSFHIHRISARLESRISVKY